MLLYQLKLQVIYILVVWFLTTFHLYQILKSQYLFVVFKSWRRSIQIYSLLIDKCNEYDNLALFHLVKYHYTRYYIKVIVFLDLLFSK